MKTTLVRMALVALAAGSVHADEADSPLVLVGANLFDPDREKLVQGQDVLLIKNRIAAVSKFGENAGAAGLRRLNLSGLTLLPGLIDLHTHLLLHPYNEAAWDDQVLKESLELRTVRATAAGKSTLEAGFTTIRDLGTEGAGFADVALREAFERAIVPGPTVFATTRAIVATGCYGPAGFDPRWDVPKGAEEATGVDEVRRVVRRQIAAGADWIKVYADSPRRPSEEATSTFSQEELDALVDEARSAGRPVSAHATTDEGIHRAVLAGAATIEHGYGASEITLGLMRVRGVVLCPTLSAAEAAARYAMAKRVEASPDAPGGGTGISASDPVERALEARVMFGRARAAGVTIACGSDAGVFAHGENVRELELMVAYGMSPAEALRAARSTAAKVLGREKDLGRVAPGYVADLIAVRGNPLEDVSVLRKPVVVIKGGRVVVDKRPDGQ